MLGHVAGELGDFEFGFEVFLETGVEDFSVGWFEAVEEGWDCSFIIRNRKMNQLFIHKILIRQNFHRMIHKISFRGRNQPLFPLIRQLTPKRQFHHFIILLIQILKLDLMNLQILKVLLRLL